MLLSELMTQTGMSASEVEARLAAGGVTFRRGSRAGEPVDADYITKRGSSDVPKLWLKALGVEASPRSSPGSEGGGTPGGPESPSSSGRRETPPKRPAEAKITVELVPGDNAKKWISGGYKFLGGSLADGANVPGVAVVWNDLSDPIAEAWIRAAAENPIIARLVNSLNGVGATSELVGMHLYLAGATFYVLGSSLVPPEIGNGVYAKYAKHRVVVPQRPAAGAGANGNAAAAPAEGSAEAEPAAAGAVDNGPA